MIIVSAAEMQAMDRQTIEDFGIPGRVLMEAAGRGATRSFLERLYKKGPGRIGIIAGRGNNGGDGFVMARYLAQRGLDVKVFLLAGQDRVQGDAAANLHLLPALKVPVVEIPDKKSFERQKSAMAHIHYWIDAILGTGLTSDVKGYYRQIIEFINSRQLPVLAVDIPSGLNSDTGQPCGISIQAAATATFAFAKIGHLVYPGPQYCGPVDIIDIGIPPFIADKVGARQHLITAPTVHTSVGQRPPDAHKGRTGHLLVAAGATGKTGAAAMTAEAALRMGAGLVTLAIPESLNPILETRLVEVMTTPLADEGKGFMTTAAYGAIAEAAQGKQCLALGPGLGTAAQTRDLVLRMVKEIELPMVIDADGLNHLAGHLAALQKRTAPTVLTPHPGEMARLVNQTVGEIQRNRVAAARDLAMQCQAHVVLKGARTLVAHPDGGVWINPTGNAGMASGGMGDVLTGAIAGLLAQGCSAGEAARAGVYLHGLAADILCADRPWGYLATEVMEALPKAIQQVRCDAPAEPVRNVFF